MRVLRKKSFWILLSAAALLTCRVAIPLTVEGDWMGSLTKCACNMYSFLRFQDGRAVMYGHGGEPDASPRNLGTYTKIGWNKYRWETAWNRCGPITVRVGWFLSSFEGVQGTNTLYCWRYPLHAKADWIVRESQRLAAEKPGVRTDEPRKQ
jgi:hypothetical protein